ncbi:MAG: hypothetical protein EBX41_03630 [Chitinophagia bacterium]|nr:hypothetical protein [Chitinophagia bacterium]
MNVRALLDIAMGIVYLLFAGMVYYYKKFGVFDLGIPLALALAGLLVLYGGFRVYRGVVELRR